MSEFKGTKWPWKYVHQNHATKPTGQGQRYAVMANTINSDDKWLYNIKLDKTDDTDRHIEADANARLIAAAPDMLSQLEIESEFLDEVIGMLKNNDAHSSNIQKVTDRRKRIEQQISEALGE